MRRKFRWSPEHGKLIEVQTSAPSSISAYVVPDIPDYVSPVTGLWVNGRKQRREDLKRSGSRPYEGREIEQQIANSYRESQERLADKKLERDVVEVWQHSPERIRKMFK